MFYLYGSYYHPVKICIMIYCESNFQSFPTFKMCCKNCFCTPRATALDRTYLLKDMQIFSLHMNISEKPNVLHFPVQAKYLNFNSYIFILYYQSKMLYNFTHKPACYPYKMVIHICNRGVGTASQQNSCTQRHSDTR